MRARDDFALAHDNCPYRHFLGGVCFLCLSQCVAHEILIGWRLDHPPLYNSSTSYTLTKLLLAIITLLTFLTLYHFHRRNACPEKFLRILGTAHGRQH